MRIVLPFFLLLFAGQLPAQALRDINFNFLYDPDEKMVFTIRPVREASTWTITWSLELQDTLTTVEEYTIAWESRTSMIDKENTALVTPSQSPSSKSRMRWAGQFRLEGPAPPIVVAKISNTVLGRSWTCFHSLDNNFPIDGFVSRDAQPVTQKHVGVGSRLRVHSPRPQVVSFYNDRFPAAVPGFSMGQAKVQPRLKADSVFNVNPGEEIMATMKGLYLFQSDTMSSAGFALRAEDDYPRFSKVQNLPGPLVYICTREEFNRLVSAGGDKKAFDRTVLTIAGSADRARTLIRNYFRRVELANRYFTSYKEGWKTDRGMVYIIFGMPEEVSRLEGSEVWRYKNEMIDLTFSFVRSGSVFDPENYVLIRDDKYREKWYEVIDLWRNARF